VTIATLKTGDYTLRGYEGVVVVERKKSPSEIANNLFEARFERELERMEAITHPFIFLDFPSPTWTTTPHRVRPPLGPPPHRLTGRQLLKRIHEFELKYKARWFCTEGRGRTKAISLFKRILEKYPTRPMASKVQRRVDEVVAELDFNARHHWLGLGDVSRIKTGAPLDDDQARPVFERVMAKMQDPAYLAWTCATLFDFHPHPFQGVALRELWQRPFPMLVWTRGGSKTTTLGIYALLRALLDQGSKVLLVSAAFRQAKGIFDVCAKRWYDSPMLRSLVGNGLKQGPRFEVDRCSITLGDSTITAIPLGNGEKVRGMRATHLLIDEFKSVPIDIVENVVVGFAAVSADPMEKVKRAAYLAYLKAHGLYSTEMDEEGGRLASNQTVISGTAYYGFNHFAQYFRKWKAFVECRNDPRPVPAG
jgi:hypothetical protein